MAKIKSAWWRQQSLAALTTLTPDQIERQAKAYRAWLATARGWSAKETGAYIEATRSDEFATATVAGGTVARSEYFGEVELRTIKPHSGGWHFGAPDLISGRPVWRRHPSSAAVPLYVVIRNGRWVDSFLAKSRASACAKAMAGALAYADQQAAIGRPLARAA